MVELSKRVRCNINTDHTTAALYGYVQPLLSLRRLCCSEPITAVDAGRLERCGLSTVVYLSVAVRTPLLVEPLSLLFYSILRLDATTPGSSLRQRQGA